DSFRPARARSPRMRRCPAYHDAIATKPSMILTAGPISVTYDSGALRYIRCGGVEVLRQIYVALRDSHWGTVPDRVSDESIVQGADWFRIEFTVTHRQGEIAFAWDGCIEGRQDGTMRFAMSGGAASSFLANRIGFCV